MSIKSSITWGFVAMLVLLVGVGGYAYYTVGRLDRSARAILQDNFYSVQLGQEMLRALDRSGATPDAASLTQFGKQLTREAGNVTEPGEQALVDTLTRTLASYRQQPTAAELAQLRGQTHRMVQLNMQALTRKNDTAAHTATLARRYLILCALLGLLLASTLVLSVPEAAVGGLRKLSASIDHATQGDFKATIPVESRDEFGRVAQGFNRLLAQLDDFRRTNLTEVMTERNRAASIVRTLAEGILLLDENGVVLVANPLACQLLGLPERQVIGQPLAELVGEQAPWPQLLAYAQQPASQRREALPFAVRERGEENQYQLMVHEVFAAHPTLGHLEVAGTILALHNVSGFAQRDRTKSHFLATAAHELRTPLSSINFHLKLLQDARVGALNAEQQQLVGNVKRETQRLLQLTGKLLDVAKLEENALPFAIEPVSVAELVEAATTPVQLQLPPKQLHLTVQLPPDLPPVLADREKATWVLLNLLTNAVRHSPEQSTIAVTATMAPGGRAVRVQVEDHGPGIAVENQERIFGRFAQLPGLATDAPRPGSGLGLSIGREFMAAQHGELGVESSLGTGSVFFLTLPVPAELSA